jgi:membrane associated rhomboid family serine protease
MFPLYDDNPVFRTPVVTYGLVLINLLAFLWLFGQPDARQELVIYQRGFVPARLTGLVHPQPIPVADNPLAQLPRLTASGVLLTMVTCMFLHASWPHVIGNMWFLWIFGNNVEDRLGSLPYLIFYLAGGLLASFAHWLFAPDSILPVVGASGAVAAILGAYAVTWPQARVQTLVFLFVFVTFIQLPALLVLGVWFFVQIASAVATQDQPGGGVAWWAHIGGFLAGMIAMPILRGLTGGGPPSPSLWREDA